MSKGKKIYCIASFMFAIMLIIMALTICLMFSRTQRVYASSAADTEGTSRFDSANRQDNTVTDNNDGLWFSWNNSEGNVTAPIRMLIVLTVLSLAPSIMIMLTSFTRIIVVLHFTRTALGTQTSPPNQVMVGLALFLTMFIMSPVFSRVNTEVIQPLDKGEITVQAALERVQVPFREFMYPETQTKDINLFCDIAGVTYEQPDEIPFSVLVSSFIISELRTAFIIGFILYIPFIVIDMVVSSVLMSMGMMMLPPTTISMPFKILLFVLADGWNLIVGNLVKTFH